jgi:rhodanese-related sulfurtransferase
MQKDSLPNSIVGRLSQLVRAHTLAAALLAGLSATVFQGAAGAAPPLQLAQATIATTDAIFVSRPDVKAGIAAGTIILVDVREPDEFAAGHIAGARLAPLSTFNPAALPREAGKQVVIYCQSGRRAQIALSLARAIGRTDIAVYSGSMLDWKAAGEPILK